MIELFGMNIANTLVGTNSRVLEHGSGGRHLWWTQVNESMDTATRYKRITVRSGEHHFSIFCAEESLQNRDDEVMQWVRRLARRLHWEKYEIAITRASESQATERLQALFEHQATARQGIKNQD